MRPFLSAAMVLATMLSGCATGPVAKPITPISETRLDEARQPVTILISIDGATPDMLTRGVTPNLNRLAAVGVQAPMRPSFPTKTFPNHWTIVTGLRPDRHGIVGNTMEDPGRPGERFTMASDDPYWWNAAEPIWVAAERAGIRTATMFWPGSNVAWGGTRTAEWPHTLIGGTRPSDWQQFNKEVTGEQRVNAALDWLRRPAEIRPRFLTLYFDMVDTNGHRFGPADARTTEAVADVDAKIGKLMDGLAAMAQPANIVVVADHGMADISSERTIALDQLLPPTDFRIVEAGPYASLFPTPGREQAVETALLRPHAHMECWRKSDIPARLHYGRNTRVPPYLCLAESGWMIAESASRAHSGGAHGYDDQDPAMAALFVASGPGIRAGGSLPAFPNVDVYSLLRRLIGLPVATDKDGDPARFASVLVEE